MAVEGKQRVGSFLRHHGLWIALGGLLLSHLLLAVFLFDPKPFVGGDNAGYMILAESLESGRGYRDIHLPGAPRHAQYPPVYPALLAGLRALGGGLLAFKTLSVFFSAGAVLLLFLLARARRRPWEALAITIPLALSPVLLDYSHWVLSEAPFVVLTISALWVMQRRAEPRGVDLALATGLALLAYLTRAAGLPLLLAMIVALAWRRRWRPTAAVSGAVGAVVGLWWLWGRLATAESAREYTENFLYVNPYMPELGYVGPGDLILRVVNNVRLYVVEVIPQSLASGAAGPGPGLATLIGALLLVALALAGWVRSARRVGVLEAFTVLYTGLLLVWPQVWTDRRFLLPLLPVLLLYAMEGLIWCFEFVRASRPPWTLPIAGLLIAALAVPGHIRDVTENQRCLRFYRQGDHLSCYAPAWRSFFQAAEWVEEFTPEDAIVISRKPRLFYLFSGRRGDVYPFTPDQQEVLAFLDSTGADHVAIAAISATTYRYLVPVVRAHPERFRVLYQVGSSSTAAYVLSYGRGTGEPSSTPEDSGADGPAP